MNPSQLANNADAIAHMCNLAARIARGDLVSGGLCAAGGDAGAIAVDGTGVNIDVDHAAVASWNKLGVVHTIVSATDVFATPANTVKQFDGSANFAAFSDYTAAFGDDEFCSLAVILESGADNDTPAVKGIASPVSASAVVVATDAQITAGIGHGNWVRLGDAFLQRTGADPGTVITVTYTTQGRVDSQDLNLIDITKV
jgi:hypothetical protein